MARIGSGVETLACRVMVSDPEHHPSDHTRMGRLGEVNEMKEWDGGIGRRGLLQHPDPNEFSLFTQNLMVTYMILLRQR